MRPGSPLSGPSAAPDTMSRRDVLLGVVGGALVSTLTPRPDAERGASATPARRAPVPTLHCTDLFRPFADPDDHFDLATVFALAQMGHIDLRTILIDYPPPRHNGDPDVQAVAQMIAMTGKAVPVVTGSARPFDGARVASSNDLAAELSRAPGARAILEVLRVSPAAVVIHIAGSSRDVAIAGRAEPVLFANKCAAVYLNAGSGTRDATLAKRLEYNVELDPASFAAIFALPCPVYWLPCFEVAPGPNNEPHQTGAHSSLYAFPQKDVLPKLSDRLQNYFAFAYRQGERKRAFEEQVPRANWLRALDGKRDDESIHAWSASPREMWCTAGFLHAAGLSVRADGSVVPANDATDAVFAFARARVSCEANGITSWSPGSASPARYVLTVRDESRYTAGMTSALLSLLQTLR